MDKQSGSTQPRPFSGTSTEKGINCPSCAAQPVIAIAIPIPLAVGTTHHVDNLTGWRIWEDV